MLRYAVICLAFLGVALPARANTWGESLFEELTFDFGSVPHGTICTHPFRVVNRTKQTLHIAHVRVSCGCTTGRPLQTTLAPGQDTVILVQMDTRRFYNTKDVNVYVLFDQPHYEEVRLWVQANSRDDISFSPNQLAFGKISKGSSASAQMTVTLLGNEQLQVVEARSDSNYIQPKIETLHRDAATVIYQVSAKLHADTPAGKWYTDIWLSTNSTTMPRLRIPLTVEIETAAAASPAATKPTVPAAPTPPAVPTGPAAPTAPVTPAIPTSQSPPASNKLAPSTPAPAAPTQPATPKDDKDATPVALGEVKVGIETDRKVIIRSDRPFRITRIDGADDQVSVGPVSGESLSVHVITLTLRPGEPGSINRTIRVQTDLQQGGNLAFTAQATVVP